MDWPSGTVVYTRDLALELLRRGHRPIVYTWLGGAVGRELESAGVPVFEDLWRLRITPDVIHGHHRPLVRGAILRFPGVPVVACCHNPTDPWDAPAPDPQIGRYLGVSELCAKRFLDLGAPAARISVRPNFVDLARFTPRPPLPVQPARALIFSNYATAETHLPAIQAAAERLGLSLEVVGRGVGRTVDDPERLLPNFDLVFAVGKSALEAMAVGTAVVLCDRPGLGPMVTAAEFPGLRTMNFGLAALVDPVTPEGVERAVARYDPADAARVQAMVRSSCGLESAASDLIEIYRRVIDEAAAARDADPASGSKQGSSRRRLAVARYRLSKAPTVAFYRVFGMGSHPVPAPLRPAYRLARTVVRRLLDVR
jgi:glycosyltransferase involved in cell wall biosynthesis